MFKTISILVLAILSLCVAASACVDCAGALSFGITMQSGTDTFQDQISTSGNIGLQSMYQMGTTGVVGQTLAQIGPGCAQFNENTITSFSKSGGPSDDPYMSISKGMSNTGSGVGYSTMQFSDTGYWSTTHAVNLVSGLQTDDHIDSAYLNSYFTNYVDMSSTGNAAWNKDNVQAFAGLKFDRQTYDLTVTPLQISEFLTPFATPTSFPLTFT